MKKLVFRAPVQTASGYGVHSRMLLKALDKSGKFDITVMSVPWGNTPLIYSKTPEMNRVSELAHKFNPQVPPNFDASVQVTIPNEFARLAPINIGVTAGIETNQVAPVWQQKCNENVDVVVVPSVHSARAFTQGIYNSQDGSQLLLRKPLYILPEWVDTGVFNTSPTDPDPRFNFPAAFNFITVGLGMDKNEGEDRKNITQLVKWFCEQFKGNPDVGLVLKVSMVNASPVDFKAVASRIQFIKNTVGCGQFPRVHLIHGRLGDQELAALYKHPRVKAFVSLTHGEGYGLPLIEAAACGLPVVATNWSGHLDFLQVNGKRRFVPVEYKLEPIPQPCVWKDVLEQGTMWANPFEKDAKMKMQKLVLSYDTPKQWALELAANIADKYNESIGDVWAEDMAKLIDGQRVQLTKTYGVVTKPRPEALSSVSLVCVDSNASQAAHAIRKTLEQVTPAEALLVTEEGQRVPDGLPPFVRVITPFKEGELSSVAAYDEFIMRKLGSLVSTDYVLNIQWDGYVLNGSAWSDEFLKYDLVGAPWFWDRMVGNMGFSLLSRRLLLELANNEKYPIASPMDNNVCRVYKPQLEEAGIKFAPYELAGKFSVENEPYTGQFGWHGKNPFYGEPL